MVDIHGHNCCSTGEKSHIGTFFHTVLMEKNRNFWYTTGFQKDGHMDQDTYEQFIQLQISLDELQEKMNLVLDEIDELKKKMEKKSCGQLSLEQQRTHTSEKINYEISGPGYRLPVVELLMC